MSNNDWTLTTRKLSGSGCCAWALVSWSGEESTPEAVLIWDSEFDWTEQERAGLGQPPADGLWIFTLHQQDAQPSLVGAWRRLRAAEWVSFGSLRDLSRFSALDENGQPYFPGA